MQPPEGYNFIQLILSNQRQRLNSCELINPVSLSWPFQFGERTGKVHKAKSYPFIFLLKRVVINIPVVPPKKKKKEKRESPLPCKWDLLCEYKIR